ncbi:MAG TPA: ADP-ribosylglycohydrolase family protein [Umezawaea sp.]|nr:ADP-ribosylglycohydrolase family protein [Umezawaea sp.]
MTTSLDSLNGLSVGDALGAQYFVPGSSTDALPDSPWPWTDDTEMAFSVFTELRDRGRVDQDSLARLFAGQVRDGVVRARELLGVGSAEAAHELGNGSRVTAQDTVPFTLWVAATHLADYPTAITACVRAGGDIDTTSAIVGGIVAAHTGVDGIPPEWLAAREPLPDQVDGHRTTRRHP